MRGRGRRGERERLPCEERGHDRGQICRGRDWAARVLNGDGGSWVREPYDPDTVVQLDRYHVYQAILRNIGDKKVQKSC